MGAVPSERLPVRRQGGKRPSGGDALRARVLGERERVARLALLRSGVRVLLGGGVSAGIGWVIGSLGPELFGA